MNISPLRRLEKLRSLAFPTEKSDLFRRVGMGGVFIAISQIVHLVLKAFMEKQQTSKIHATLGRNISSAMVRAIYLGGMYSEIKYNIYLDSSIACPNPKVKGGTLKRLARNPISVKKKTAKIPKNMPRMQESLRNQNDSN